MSSRSISPIRPRLLAATLFAALLLSAPRAGALTTAQVQYQFEVQSSQDAVPGSAYTNPDITTDTNRPAPAALTDASASLSFRETSPSSLFLHVNSLATAAAPGAAASATATAYARLDYILPTDGIIDWTFSASDDLTASSNVPGSAAALSGGVLLNITDLTTGNVLANNISLLAHTLTGTPQSVHDSVPTGLGSIRLNFLQAAGDTVRLELMLNSAVAVAEPLAVAVPEPLSALLTTFSATAAALALSRRRPA